VAPCPDALVAAPAAAKVSRPGGGEPKQVRVAHAWRFPIRRASQTHYLKPEELPLHMNPQTRRAYIRLDSIPPRDGSWSRDVRAYFKTPSNFPGVTVQGELNLQLNDVSLEKNAITLRYFGKLRATGQVVGSNSVRVPLMDVEDAWEFSDQMWAVRVRGCLSCSEEIEVPFKRPYWKLTYILLH
jgi:hypothetical protein